DVDSILESLVDGVNLPGSDIQVDFAPVARAWLSAGVEHHFALAEPHDGKRQAVRAVVPRVAHGESDGGVPLNGRADVGHMNHRSDGLRHALSIIRRSRRPRYAPSVHSLMPIRKYIRPAMPTDRGATTFNTAATTADISPMPARLMLL